ncbi:MAG: outer membrane beta-barrel protein [Nitrospira sp.]|nr:outer membrane beta-barrel protein [Nitrospira sp.]HBP89983.1 hypothetical protein [Nitrospiraceae bacterium]HNP28753.1 hypothetical protein [Nitrospirales bacterium]
MMIDKWVKTILALLALLLVFSFGVPYARAENQWGFGTDIGFLADTYDDTVFTLSFQGDYYLNSQLSIGPQILISPAGDLTQVTVAGIGRYHIPMGAVTISPFAGLGIVYAELDEGPRDNDDVSFSLPFGATAAFKVSRTVSLASTLIFTFQDLGVPSRVSSDNFNIGMLFGFRFQP